MCDFPKDRHWDPAEARARSPDLARSHFCHPPDQMFPPRSLLSWEKKRKNETGLGPCSIYHTIVVPCDLGKNGVAGGGGSQKWKTLNSSSTHLDVCKAQREGDREEGEAQSPGVTVSGAHNSPLCPSLSPSSSPTQSTQHPVYLPPGPGSISGATPTRPTHRHCQTLCPRAWFGKQHTP